MKKEKKMEEKDRIIKTGRRSVIVAADVSDLKILANLVQQVAEIPKISGFKIGFRLAFKELNSAIRVIRAYSRPDQIIIYDHQKAGNDIPDMGLGFAKDLAEAGVDAAILFPFAGPSTQEVWTRACFDAGLQVLTGGIMTHPQFLVKEGGYIADDAPEKIFRYACRLGVRHFVVPGNKLDWIRFLKDFLTNELGPANFTLSAPGFITQKGDISECAQAVGSVEWHAIVGSAIYKAENIKEAAKQITRQITA